VLCCLDVGGSFIKVGTARGASVDYHGKAPTPARDWPAFVVAVAGLIAEAKVPAGAPVALSIAGIFDPDSGYVTKAANIPCLEGHRLRAELGEALGRPVSVANDADCFALAEAVAGAGQGHRIVFGAILGTGVGGGLIVEGRMVRGAGGMTGEWGHGPIAGMVQGADGPMSARFACGCGQVGCLDAMGGARGLERLHEAMSGERQESREIVERWKAGDSVATRTIIGWRDVLADPLALVVNVVGASIIPVGGGLSGEPGLVHLLDVAVRARILRRLDAPLVVPATLGGDAGLIGAAVLGAQEWQQAPA
jgi:N-acetylglucosamine kinase